MPQQPHIFVLSLSDNEKRRAPLIQQLENMGLEYTIWDAIDGRQHLPKQYESQIDKEQSRKRMGRDMSNAEFACALSHRAIQQDIIDRDLTGALVLEDDAVLTESFPEILPLLPIKGQDLTLLFYQDGYSSWRSTPILKMYTARRVTFNPYSAAAYYITRAGAEHMVAANTPISHTSDWPIDLSRIGTFAIQPCIALAPEPTVNNSNIEISRKNTKPFRRNRHMRFLDLSYWRRKYLKLTSKTLRHHQSL